MKLFRHSTRKATEPFTNLRTERGAALIIVLVMLLLLTIIGATLFTSSTTEIRISGNQRNSLETFFAADAAVEFATTYGTIYTSIVPGVTTTWPDGKGFILDENYVSTGEENTKHPGYNQITIPGDNGRTKVNIKVELIKERADPPPGYGYQVDAGINPGSGGIKFNMFAVSAIAEGPNNARVDVESEIARIAPQ